jgi:hypothetical protein
MASSAILVMVFMNNLPSSPTGKQPLVRCRMQVAGRRTNG